MNRVSVGFRGKEGPQCFCSWFFFFGKCPSHPRFGPDIAYSDDDSCQFRRLFFFFLVWVGGR